MTVNATVTHGIIESCENGLVILASATIRPRRRVLYVNSYGGKQVWNEIKRGALPPQHLWGCIELARMGYEVALAEPLEDFYWRRKPLPHDAKYLNRVRSWLGNDGIAYCGHNVLYWLPLLRALGAIRCSIVSHLFAKEPLNFARAHSGIIALTPAAERQARLIAPKSKVARLAWGAALDSYPLLPYRPEVFLSCGITNRDHQTLSVAASKTDHAINVICPQAPSGVTWPNNVSVIESGRGWCFEAKKVSFQDMIDQYHARSAASLIIVKEDPNEYIACGFTEFLEAIALGRPVILTRTGALPDQVNVEEAGCGLYVPPKDEEALAEAIDALASDPTRAEAMGRKGRQMAEQYYNMDRYSRELHEFFERL